MSKRDRQPENREEPQDTEAEEWTIGALLIDHEAIDRVGDIVQPTDFYHERHRWIYEAAISVSDRFEVVNQLTVAKELQDQDRLEVIGGVAYLSQLVAQVFTSVWAESYARIVRDRSFQRQLIRAAGQIARIGYEGGDTDALLGQCQEMLLGLATSHPGEGWQTFGEIATAHLPEARRWTEHHTEPSGIPTRLPDLDKIISGLKRSTFYVLAARPSVGKSQLALALAVNVAKQGHPVGIFTLEMSKPDLYDRATFAAANLNRIAIQRGEGPFDWQERYWAAYDSIQKLPISVDSTDAITTGTVRLRVAQLKTRYPNLGAVFFDYGELAGDEADTEELRVSGIAKRLAAMAHGLDIPVVGVFQLNRRVEERARRVPQLSDLRYSGFIEQAADVVLMLYRIADDAKNDPALKASLQPNDDKRLDVLIEKQRNGPKGRISLWYDQSTGRIGSWEGNRG